MTEASVSAPVTQGESVRPPDRLLRALPVRPPPRRHCSAGGRLEGSERRRRRAGVCLGDEDGSEAVGDAQQVRRRSEMFDLSSCALKSFTLNVLTSYPIKYKVTVLEFRRTGFVAFHSK